MDRRTAILVFTGAALRADTSSPSVTFESEHWVKPPWDGRMRNAWRSGKLYGVDGDQSEMPLLYTMDSGGRRDNVPITIDGQRYIAIWSYAPAFDGSIEVGSYTTDKNGKPSSFVSRIAPGGASRMDTNVWPYTPEHIPVPPTGKTWTMGWVRNPDDPDGPTVALNVRKRFDEAGKEIESVGIRARRSMPGGTFARAFLRATRDRVVWFSEGNDYVEWSLDGRELLRIDGPAVKNDHISGVAVGDDNIVIVAMTRYSPNRYELLMLDRANSRWIPVEVTNKDRRDYWWPVGWDGDTIVFRTPDTIVRYNFSLNR
jgi:hypothetical protein